MTNRNHGIVSGSIGFVSRGSIQVLLFLVTIVATRFLSVAEFGSYALASSFLFLSRALFYVGPYEYLLKSRDSERVSGPCFRANLVLGLISSLCLVGFYFVSPMLFNTQTVGQLIFALIPSVFFAATSAWYEAIMLRSQRVQRYYAYTVIGESFGSVIAVLLLIRGYGVFALVLQTYARLGLLILLYAFTTRARPSFWGNWAETRTIIDWSWHRYATVFLNFVSGYGADFILGVFLSPAATGIYRASNRIVSALTDLFAQPLQKIAQTNLFARVARNEDVGTNWLAMLAGVGAIGWAAMTALAFSAHDLIPLVLGEKWAPAVPVVMVFCVVKAFSLIDSVTTALLVCHDRQRTMVRIQMAVSGLVVLVAWLSAGFGPTVVAAAVGLVLVGMSLTYAWLALRQSRVTSAALLHTAVTALAPAVSVAATLTLFDLLHVVPTRHGVEILLIIPVVMIGFLIGAYPVRHRILSAIGHLGHSGTAS